MKRKSVILLILLLVSSAIRAKVTFIWLPDPVLIFLLPLIFHIEPRWVGPVALAAGILRDGLYIDIPWISPLLFTVAGAGALIYRTFVNASLLIPKIAFFTVSIVLYYVAYLYANQLGISTDYLRAILLTIVFTTVVELWLRKS